MAIMRRCIHYTCEYLITSQFEKLENFEISFSMRTKCFIIGSILGFENYTVLFRKIGYPQINTCLDFAHFSFWSYPSISCFFISNIDICVHVMLMTCSYIIQEYFQKKSKSIDKIEL